MIITWKKLIAFSALLMLGYASLAQSRTPFFQPADTLNKDRFWICTGAGFAVYAGFSYALYQTWYKDFELVGFHTFNDLGEWNDMDKMGHAFTANMEANLVFNGARWTGMRRRDAMWTAAGVATLLQATIEVMDGFSAKWGFSWADMGFNTIGVGLFVSQELLWQDQRILLKTSSTRPNYSNDPILSVEGNTSSSLKARADDLYGTTFAETFLKDYNGQNIWLSINPRSFRPNSKLPKWLNIAIGYGADNMFGGFSNQWEDDDGNVFRLDPVKYPRHRQFYLSLDIDLSRIKTKSRFLRALLTTFNWIKIPAPAFEVNTLGKVKFHPIFW